MKWLILLLMVGSASAVDLNIGLYTDHIGADGFNENNQLIGLTIGRYEIGTYENSYDVRSIYAARRIEYNDKFGVMTGLVSGYSFSCVQGLSQCRESDIMPMFAGYMRINDYLTITQMANAVMLIANIRGIFNVQ